MKAVKIVPARPIERCADAELAKDPAANECSNDANDDVADESDAADEHRGENAGHQADDEPGKQIHFASSEWKVIHPGSQPA